MKKLIEALHVIQDECRKYCNDDACDYCPLSSENGMVCSITDLIPDLWKINDEVEKALL